MDTATRIARDLLTAIRRLQNSNIRHNGRHSEALRTLATIFATETTGIQQTEATAPQTSTNPTDPTNIRSAPRMHNRRTRANTPGIIPPTATQMRQTTEGEMATTEGETEPERQISEGEHVVPPTWDNTPRPPHSTKRRRSTTTTVHDVPGGAHAERARARAKRQENDVRIAQETTRQTPQLNT